MQRAALANLATLGFRVTSIALYRATSGSAGLAPLGTVEGGVLPADLVAPLGLAGADDVGGGRYPFVGYVGGTIMLQAGDELRITDNAGTAIYPVQGVSPWQVIQVLDLERREHG